MGRHLALALTDDDVVLGARNNKQNEMAARATGREATPLDVTSIESIRDAVRRVRPEVIVHAAATKFVDLAERQPLECVDVNVVGSQNVARVAIDCGVEHVLGISTDKASPPVRNTYGLSKAMMERVFCGLDGTASTGFACVRYGNVAWSTGSVLPVWQAMHRETGVIGTTGPHMRRFFFTIDEAVALVRVALNEFDAVRGKVLARHMKAARVSDLLDVWVTEFGGKWEQIEGRPGEREDEYLVGDLELPFTEQRIIGDVPHYLIAFNQQSSRSPELALSSANTARLSPHEMADLVRSDPQR